MFLVWGVEHMAKPLLQSRSINGGASDEDKDYGFHFEHVELLMAVKSLLEMSGTCFTNLDLRDNSCAKI